MELILDTASVKDIKELCEILNIDGVTTNPSILSRQERTDLDNQLNEIIAILKPEQKFFVEVLANNCDDMVKEAEYINCLRENTYAKIPVSAEGLKAIKICHERNLKTLATAVFTSTQAYLAGKNGADYIAPYCNRMKSYQEDYIEETLLMQQFIWENEFNCKIVAASFKEVDQIKALMKGGIDAVTINPDLCRAMFIHEGTDKAIEGFEKDWYQRYNRLTLKD